MAYTRSLAVVLAVAALAAGCGGGSDTAEQSAISAMAPQSTAAGIFPGNRSGYTVAAAGSGWTVTDLATGIAHSISGVPSLQFADVTVNLQISGRAATIAAADLQLLTELYVAFFNRVPEADGLSFWIGEVAAGRSIDSVADAFYAAAVQYSDLTGYSPSMTNEGFVRVIYSNVLGRSGDTAPPDADVQWWAGRLASGAETKGSLVKTMLGSAHSFKGNGTWGWVADLLDNKLAVARSFAIDNGLNYNSPEVSIARTMAIAAAVTSASTAEAAQLITAVVGSGSSSGGGGTGHGAATYAEASIPGYDVSVTNVVDYVVTNRGLYMLDSGGERILKLHGSPTFNRWSTASFAGGIWSYAPTNVYSEREDEVSFYYAAGAWNAPVWGLYAANTGNVPGFEVEDDIGISLVAAAGTGTVPSSRPWVVARGKDNHNSDYQYLWQDDGSYTSVRKASDYFGTPAGTDTVAASSLLTHPTDGTVFMASGNRLSVYSADGRASTIELAGGSWVSMITDMTWHDGNLWFAYANKIYKRSSSGTVAFFTEITGMAAMMDFGLPGRFCLNGGDVITPDGLATRISDGAVRGWISSGTLSPDQQVQSMLMSAQVAGSGVYCSPNNLARAIYVPNHLEGKVRMYFGL